MTLADTKDGVNASGINSQKGKKSDQGMSLLTHNNLNSWVIDSGATNI